MSQRRPIIPSEIPRLLSALAERHGWRYHHSLPGRRLDGYADFFPTEIMLAPGRLVFLALAGADGRIDPAGQTWLDALDDIRDVRAVVIHRDDVGAITTILQGPTLPEVAGPGQDTQVASRETVPAAAGSLDDLYGASRARAPHCLDSHLTSHNGVGNDQ